METPASDGSVEPGTDAGVQAPSAAGQVTPTGDSGTVVSGDSGVTEQDAGPVVCVAKTAPKVRAAGMGPFCPFSAPVDGSTTSFKGANCAATESCCTATSNTGKTGACTAANTTCAFQVPDGGTRWACAGNNHCSVGKSCYLVHTTREGAKPLAIAPEPGCPADYLAASNAMGTQCKTTPDSMDIRVCALDDTSACPSGTVCTAFRSFGRDLGYCK